MPFSESVADSLSAAAQTLHILRPGRRCAMSLLALALSAVPGLAAPKYPPPPPEFFTANKPGRPLLIAPGDVLTIRFYYSPELNKTVKVREDGKISLDLFQGIAVAGMTPEDLHQKLQALYSKEFTDPVITVDVDSASGSIYVSGEVLAPGVQPWHSNLTVAMVLAVSHVSQKSAGLKSVFLVRNAEPGKYRVYKLDASMPGGQSSDVQLAPGDVLFVPRKFIVKADDFMEQYVRQLLPATPTAAADVIFSPGNATVVSAASTASH